MYVVGNDRLSLAFSSGPGVELVSLRDKLSGHEYLSAPSMLFEFAVNNGTPFHSNSDLAIDAVPANDGTSLRIDCHALDEPLKFSVAVTGIPGGVLIVEILVRNTGSEDIFLRTVLPKISGLVTGGDSTERIGAVPKEMGGVAPLVPGALLGMPLNLDVGLPTAMNTMELAAVFDGGGRGGVFFADVDGDLDNDAAPLQFTLSKEEVAGFWIATLAPGHITSAPAFAVGVHSDGDWRAAVDWYTTVHRARWTFPDTPAWIRQAGAIYTFAGGGAGSIYLALPAVPSLGDGQVWTTWEVGDGPWMDGEDQRTARPVTRAGFAPAGGSLAAVKQSDTQLDVFVVRDDGAVWVTFETGNGPWSDGDQGREPLRVSPAGLALPGAPVIAIKQNERQLNAFVIASGRLGSFRELPRLLAEARTFGTDVVYLWDYWLGASEGFDPPYWNKGDYVPRSDLGGESALIDGITSLHQQGGRIVLYLEPFIVYEHSQIARTHGGDWGATHDDRTPFTTYPRNIEMVAPFIAWQDYVVAVAQRLVGQYGADGVFLDSYAWQMNWPMKAAAENRLYSPLDYSLGVLRLTERVREAVQAINPEAAVLGETTAGPIARHWDGGLAADFGFAASPGTPRRLPASPVRYGIPETTWFSNGTDLNGLQQVFAAGHGLALCGIGFMRGNADHIRRLVEIRRQYADALVSGQQIYQPITGNDEVVAYRYHGELHDLMTIVNKDDTTSYTVSLALQATDANTRWNDLINSSAITANKLSLDAIEMPAASIRVFVRTSA